LSADGALDEEYVDKIAAAFGIKRDRVLAHQWVDKGARVGRAGTIEITADADGTVWVGGAATGYIRGIITL
jgi:predicted PhzF superfamily epimerase YddE/YHI9